jgi:beta-galactosidase
MNKLLSLFVVVIILSGCGNPDFQKAEIIVTGTSQPVISLNGVWKFTMNPPENFFSNKILPDSWSDIKVPGECAMQGFAIRHNMPFVYKKSFTVPEDYEGKILKIRFEGVYSYARVWINGVFIRDHSGGFTPWECDITDHIKPGNVAWLTVEVTDMDNEISFGSGYAKHQIGGILRSVSLHALPGNYPESIEIQTDLDNKYTDADLNIKVITNSREKSWISFRLYDPKGNLVKINDKKFALENNINTISVPVRNPLKWDSEHPNLYTLITTIFDKRIVTASARINVGFRKVEVIGNKMFVNGQQIKLRGACRHDINPLLGRMSTPEFDKTDVLLAKEANMNFIRTSHYPPSDSFLKYCDEYGIYVEDETAVCFVNSNRGGIYRSLKQSGPEFIPQQLSQVREMVASHRNHPSVIIWSIGNENAYNEGFKQSYDYIKSTDLTRPVIFSYPGSVPDSVKCYDIISLHYPLYNGDLEQYGIKVKKFISEKTPVLYDEWAHVACYDKPELLEDKNVRNFWAQSLDSMWTNLFESDGGLGGAIWGMIDETFMLPDTLSGYNKWWGIMEETNGVKMYEGPAVGYGEWGILDTWRRKKPEFWNTKKAYSPVKILIDEITDFRAGSPVVIPVYNRFNHTNLREITTKWTYRNKESITRNHNIEPFKKGEIQLSPENWTEGEFINIKFFQNDTSLIDEYNLRLGKREALLPSTESGNIKITELREGKVRIEGNMFSALLNKTTGLLEDIVSENDTLIKSGPWLHYRYPATSHWSVVPMTEIKNSWKPEKVTYNGKEGYFNVRTKGSYKTINIDFNVKIYENGTMIIAYNINGIPVKSPVQEFGLKFLTGNEFDTLRWDRKSYWNAYPPFHLGIPEGEVSLYQINKNRYREKPSGIWEFDSKSFYYDGLVEKGSLSYITSSMKENIYSYSLSTPDKSVLTVYSAADKACRIARNDKDNYLYINRFWDYTSLNWGNYMKNIQFPKQLSDTIYLKIN